VEQFRAAMHHIQLSGLGKSENVVIVLPCGARVIPLPLRVVNRRLFGCSLPL
jgi:hypothetical protein